ncbi:unnamed protein product [Ilex paraguariensis]|uniref:Uncharacterized protein n=1 Tax=Ilex paraguariensis TaxID=185542 RepID=A0ABC8QTL7_9AQUA
MKAPGSQSNQFDRPVWSGSDNIAANNQLEQWITNSVQRKGFLFNSIYKNLKTTYHQQNEKANRRLKCQGTTQTLCQPS